MPFALHISFYQDNSIMIFQDANADDFSDEDEPNNSDTQNQSETNGSGDSSEGGEEKDLVESRV